MIGCAGDKSNGFTGYLDDFRIYNCGFNSSQVSNLYSNRNLVAHYPFDSSLNGLTPNHATLTYDGNLVGNANITTANVLSGSGALNLTNSNGSANYVKSSSGFSTASTNGISISLWFKATGVSGSKMRLIDLCTALGTQGITIDISGTNSIVAGYNGFVGSTITNVAPIIIPTFQNVYEDFATISSIIYQDSNPQDNPSSNPYSIYYIGIKSINNTYIYPNSFFTSNNNTWYISNNNSFQYATINSSTDVIGQENSYYYTSSPMQYLSANSRVFNMYYSGSVVTPIANLYTNINIISTGTYSVSFATSFRDKTGGYINLKVALGSSYIIFNNTNTLYASSGNVSLSAYYKNGSGTSAVSTLMQNNPVINALRGTLCFITLTFTNVTSGTNILSFGADTLSGSGCGFTIAQIGVNFISSTTTTTTTTTATIPTDGLVLKLMFRNSTIPTTDDTGTIALTNNGCTIVSDVSFGNVLLGGSGTKWMSTNLVTTIPFTRSFWLKATAQGNILCSYQLLVQYNLTKIYGDQSLLINEITNDNFKNFIDNLIKGHLISEEIIKKEIDSVATDSATTDSTTTDSATTDYDPDSQPTFLLTELFNLIILKNNIAEIIWYILTGLLVTSIIYNYLVNNECKRSIKQMQNRHKNYLTLQEEINNKKKNITKYDIN
jgi:hypothetical protein